jgi:hypothetical protein
MRTWLKWTLLATALVMPALGYAVTRSSADSGCPIADCPCNHR